jgi:PadR family transcriptional regulator, regulatory protein PadR
MALTQIDVLRGTLDMLVLKSLSWGPAHGFAVARWIAQATDDALRIEEGSLYPALYRLEERGMIEAEWGLSENNRKAKFYRLTPAGRRELRTETASWARYAQVIFSALQAPASPVIAEGSA